MIPDSAVNASGQRPDAAFRCPGCGTREAELYLPCPADTRWDLMRCRNCELLSLRQMPAPDELASFYQENYYSKDDASRFPKPLEALVRGFRGSRARAVRKWLPPPPGRVLDVGCGRGVFLVHMRRYGYDVHGTQLSHTAAEVIRQRSGIDVFEGDLRDDRLPYPPETFDLVTVSNVLEHVPDPAGTLRVVHRVLRKGGWLLVETPNAAAWTARWGQQHWFHWDLPRHVVLFTPATVTAMLEREGFEVVASSFLSWEFGPFGAVQTVLNQALPGPRNLVFDVLQRTIPLARYPCLLAVHLAVAALLTVPALAYTLLAALCRRGDIMRFRCRRR
ncbi:MAG: hypothetical protein A3K19_27990 [Lentisphaerae bacterium RIFOXYB12_FULL_65_16]|nr:MAG: hypothetical protein A3K18_02650 [Lentisphaerae bacterium RIFOXYA12_64_32]OGV88134.1 MAG: hypothetical protein A3K19_27990 [Lentisphaerae bacterium RIFOXYB12_FULL_65_16]